MLYSKLLTLKIFTTFDRIIIIDISGAMDRTQWINSPLEEGSVAPVRVLPLTIKSLFALLREYEHQVEPKWHQQSFKYITLVARVIQTEPVFVIDDNTAALQYPIDGKIPNYNVYLRTKYYRFYLEITPYQDEELRIIEGM